MIFICILRCELGNSSGFLSLFSVLREGVSIYLSVKLSPKSTGFLYFMSFADKPVLDGLLLVPICLKMVKILIFDQIFQVF